MVRGSNSIATWDRFNGELKRQFYPENAKCEAKAKLRLLTHRGKVKDYVKEFSELLLEINNFLDSKTLFCFMDGLQPWAKVKIQWKGAQDLNAATTIAESLVDYSKPKKSKDFKHGKGKSENCHHSKDGAQDHNKHKGKAIQKDERDQWDKGHWRGPPKGFLCDRAHIVKECLKRGRLVALVEDRADP